MSKEQLAIVNEFNNILNKTKAEVDIIEKASKYVIMYQGDDDKIYCVVASNLNMIGDVHNILPTPSLDCIKAFDKVDANEYAVKNKFIKNGFGNVYQANVISYAEYAKIYLKLMTESYKTILETIK